MFETFTQWFGSMDTMLQVYWGCAIVGSIIFIIQMILTMIGMDSTDMDVDFDGPDTMDLGGSISLFSIKNFVNAIVGFGWGGVCFSGVISNPILLAFVAIIIAVLFVAMFFLIKKQTKKLESNGAFRIESSKGKIVTVYLRIPASKTGKGKVQISFNGSVQEIDAITSGDVISSGSKVRVIDIIDATTVLVEEA